MFHAPLGLQVFEHMEQITPILDFVGMCTRIHGHNTLVWLNVSRREIILQFWVLHSHQCQGIGPHPLENCCKYYFVYTITPPKQTLPPKCFFVNDVYIQIVARIYYDAKHFKFKCLHVTYPNSVSKCYPTLLICKTAVILWNGECMQSPLYLIGPSLSFIFP